MKPRRNLLITVAALAFSLNLSGNAQADTFTWDGASSPASPNWSDTGNWGGTAPADNFNDAFIFAGTTNVGTALDPLNNDGTLAIGSGGSIANSSQIIVGANTTLVVSAVSFTLGRSDAQTLNGTGAIAGNISIGTNGTLANRQLARDHDLRRRPRPQQWQHFRLRDQWLHPWKL